MPLIEIILIIIGVVILVFLIIAAILPSEKYLERTIIIDSSPDKIYSFIIDFNNYPKWNPWSQREPNDKIFITGQEGHTGHRREWDGRSGTGSLTIREFEPGKYVISDLIYISPKKMISEDIWKFEPVENLKTKVTWAQNIELGYPTDRFYGTMLEKMIGPDFERGLRNLKNLCESESR
jgi:ribosome-associated toxin RatA of RatAB toxin-antitoxin module